MKVTVEQRTTPNFSSREHPPNGLGVLHATIGHIEGDLAWIADAKSEVSYTAVIDPEPDPKSDGEFAVIYQFLPWGGRHKAWAQLGANSDTKISLAMSSPETHSSETWIRTKPHQLRTVALIVADQAQRNHLPIPARHGLDDDAEGWLAHYDLNPNNHPGNSLIPEEKRYVYTHGQTHTDPGTDFKVAWKYIMKQAHEYIEQKITLRTSEEH